MRHDAILAAAAEAFAKVLVEDAATFTIDNAPAPPPSRQTPRAQRIAIVAAAIIGAILMALSQLWNWITGG